MKDEIDFKQYFPFGNYRLNQEEHISLLAQAINNEKNIVFVAHMGSGKTSMALTAAISIAKLKKKKIIFCARTFTQNDRVLEDAQKILDKINKNKNFKIQQVKALALRGRIRMCPLSNELTVNSQTSDISMSEIIMEKCSALRKKGKQGCPYYIKINEEHIRCKNFLEQSSDDIWTEAWQVLCRIPK